MSAREKSYSSNKKWLGSKVSTPAKRQNCFSREKTVLLSFFAQLFIKLVMQTRVLWGIIFI